MAEFTDQNGKWAQNEKAKGLCPGFSLVEPSKDYIKSNPPSPLHSWDERKKEWFLDSVKVDRNEAEKTAAEEEKLIQEEIATWNRAEAIKRLKETGLLK